MATKSEFGKYRLIAELGHGGMADVFLAVQRGPEGLGFSKLVVVKRLRPNLAEDPEFIAMLIDEARIAARLNHPNAVQTYEIGEVDGHYFIAMEYLDGQPLSRIAVRATKANKPIPLTHALSIYADVLEGLHHAHSLTDYDGAPLGIVHRDVTPHNIFITYDGLVKIVDFGIAKASGRVQQTKDGVVKGKVVYMSPEQACGQQVDRRTDVFAVGVMLWETLAGARLWKGLDEVGIISRLITRDIPGPPSTVNPEVDPALDAICSRALAARREDRFETAAEMSAAILDWLKEKGQRPLPRDVGGYVADLFADRRRSTREVIESQLAQLNRQSVAFQLRVMPGSADSGRTPPRSGESAPSVTTTLPPRVDPESPTHVSNNNASPSVASAAPPSLTATLPSATSRSRRVLFGALVAGTAVAVTAAAIFAARGKAEGVSATATTTSSDVPLISSTAPVASAGETWVAVALTGDAPDTTFRIDDGAPAPAPFAGRFAKDDRSHTVIASAPGCESARHELTFDRDVAWHARLACRKDDRARSPVATAAAKRSPPAAASRALAPPAPVATDPRPEPGTAPAPTASQRPIDDTNPYAK